MLSDAKTPRAADVAAVVPENEPARQPVAAAPAEQVTVANGVPQIEAANSEAPGQSEAAKPRDGEPTMSVATTDRTGKSADNVDRRVALVMARPEIQSVSDLAGKDIAIEGEQSASTTSIQSAIASAGAADVRLDEKPARAIDRVVGGEVPAAVLNLVSPEAAQSFPDIPGYRIFRIPLAPG
jgi:ABC-type phosphate/phosphonate transport system substrate-binding protein